MLPCASGDSLTSTNDCSRRKHPGGEQGAPRLGAVVHALTGRRDRRRPRAPHRVPLQRHGQPRRRREPGRHRPGRRDGQRVQARHRYGPRAAHARVCEPRARAVRQDRREDRTLRAAHSGGSPLRSGRAGRILDEVRAGYRLHAAGSWEPLGVRPDPSAPGARPSPTATRSPPWQAPTRCAMRPRARLNDGSFWSGA